MAPLLRWQHQCVRAHVAAIIYVWVRPHMWPQLSLQVQQNTLHLLCLLTKVSLTFAGWYHDWDYLCLEAPGLLWSFGALLGQCGEVVLICAGDAALSGHVLCSGPHRVAMEGVNEPILHHGVNEGCVSELDTGPHLNTVRCLEVSCGRRQEWECEGRGREYLAHALLASSNDNGGAPAPNGLRPEYHRLQSRPAQHIDQQGGDLLRYPRLHGGLPRRILAAALKRRSKAQCRKNVWLKCNITITCAYSFGALRLHTSGKYLAHDHLRDLIRLHSCPYQGFLYDYAAQFVSREPWQLPIEGTDWSSGCTNDVYVIAGHTACC